MLKRTVQTVETTTVKRSRATAIVAKPTTSDVASQRQKAFDSRQITAR